MTTNRVLAVLSLQLITAVACGGPASDESPGKEFTAPASNDVTAAIGDWNSCYEPGWVGTVDENGPLCLEQWGSFAANCSGTNGLVSTKKVAGKRCKGVGNETNYFTNNSGGTATWRTCQYGRFDNYDSLFSGNFLASTYSCDIPKPEATNLSVTVDSSYTVTGSYTWYQKYGASDDSTVSIKICNGTSSSATCTDFGATSTATASALYSGWYAYFCVTPRFTFDGNADNRPDGTVSQGGYRTGDTTCTSTLIGGPPTASNVSVTIGATGAKGSYTYMDAYAALLGNGNTESGSAYRWQRASDSAGDSITNPSETTTTHTLVPADSNVYLRFCVTPKNGTFTGSEACSDWTAVGPTIDLYKDTGYSGTEVSNAYNAVASGTCQSLSGMGLQDSLSSFMLHTGFGKNATVTFYKDANCSGSTHTFTVTNTTGTNVLNYGINNLANYSFNDVATSMAITYN